ncbi:carboxypeptidase regulatory-like domain-containing protein [Candidatus Poribacteria bacterium]|nr:carboxypeptidase regulatory-like domain-containing protein [Candidatus Poribacteria bacterium]
MFRFSILFLLVVCMSMYVVIVYAQEDVVGGATIKGEVIDTSPEQNPIEGVTVTIVNSATGKEYTVKTDKDGAYEKKGLPAGRYMVSVSKPGYGDRVGRPKVVAVGGEIFDRIKMRKKVVAAPENKVDAAQEDVVGGATIKGQVIDVSPQQRPIAGVTVKIVNMATEKEHTVTTDKDGAYEKKGLPAGRYMISISKPGYGDRVREKVVPARGEIFDRIKMRKQENIFTFLWDIFGYVFLSLFILFILFFSGAEL